MERITSRKNPVIRYMKELGADAGARAGHGEMLCRGRKLLGEALAAGMHIGTVLSAAESEPQVPGARLYCVPAELLDYVSRGEPELLFTCSVPELAGEISSAVVLEEVQDPGNVGTVIRTAAAFGVDAVVLVGASADPYGPKALRASMGAAFRVNVIKTDIRGLAELLKTRGMTLCAAVLEDGAADIRRLERAERTALAIGNEGHGLSEELLALCERRFIIPMDEASESLNAAAAAAVSMWELFGKER